ncbi:MULTISPECIES: hypothetical protein [unclassified Shinella]|uniref:hypothetical protein n=1 Tax=unclassified Shinella TaxID=2643062 RepID=UPI000AEDC742|nr:MULTISPECIES: hypothetical protein [unclassified Shinella]
MKRIGILALSLLLPLSVAADDAWRDKAIDLIRKEKVVVEAMFPQRISLWVSVRDDGSRRDGLADYMCLLLSEAGMPKGDLVIIRILDAAALARDEMTELGKSECSLG